MQITDFYSITLNKGQSKAVNSLQQFFSSASSKVFILSGFAGTGKSTIVEGMLEYLQHIKRPFKLWASTGRAAKVLNEKTKRETQTIHQSIYTLDKKKTKMDETERMVAFKLRSNFDAPDTIYFIDEASMIADKSETNPNLMFEDGRLLQHVFNYVGNRKVVFIGDTAQLPPVNCKVSAALDKEYLLHTYKRECSSASLTEVMRQQLESGILFNATKIREIQESELEPPLSINASKFEDIIVMRDLWQLIDKYVKMIQEYGTANATFITVSNGAVNYVNQQVRNKLFRMENPAIRKGEKLMVVYNNYLHNLWNGEFIYLQDIGTSVEHKYGNEFYSATVTSASKEKPMEVKLMKEVLYSKKPIKEQALENELVKGFAMEARKKGIKQNSDKYIEMLNEDPWVNALRVRFGYATTCHKAQGGEWPMVFLNFEPVLDSFPKWQLYRWVYTAVTRASHVLVCNKKFCY